MRRKNLFMIFVVVAMLIVTMSAAVLPGAAQTTISSADLCVYVNMVSSQTVNVHQVLVPWTEGSVTWSSFYGSPSPQYVPSSSGSFVPSAIGWYCVDLTTLVQAWYDGTADNHGVLLEQGVTGLTKYWSSEYPVLDLRPKLVINGSLAVQRGLADSLVADTYIWEGNPFVNHGSLEHLYTGVTSGTEKQSLIWFDLPEVPGDGEGCTPGYWKQEQHFDSWPVDVGTTWDDAFGETGFDHPDTLLLALSARKTDYDYHELIRHAAAAYLNCGAGLDYAYCGDILGTPVGDLVLANEIYCPLD